MTHSSNESSYQHRPVRAGGDPVRSIPHDVICAHCLVVWPCDPYLIAERRAARELERIFAAWPALKARQ
jgi:hypothetical protein